MSEWLAEVTARDATNVSMGLAIASAVDGMAWPWVMIQFGSVALTGIATLTACDWIERVVKRPATPGGAP